VSPTLYDDGGFSGGTMDRPALQRLLGNIGEVPNSCQLLTQSGHRFVRCSLPHDGQVATMASYEAMRFGLDSCAG
jgi:hypothetical protein